MKTEELIARLASDAQRPVRPLQAPTRRVLSWLAVSIPWVAAVVMFMHPRPDVVAKLGDQRWLLEEVAALATAVLAAMAAFCAGVPGRPRWERWLPIAPLTVWLGTLGLGCVQDWIVANPGGLVLQPDWECLPGIVLVGLAPGIAIAVMLRRVAPLVPILSAGFGGLAAAALADFGLRLFHAQDAGIMVLVWQIGSVAALSLLSAAAGPRLTHWHHIAVR